MNAETRLDRATQAIDNAIAKQRLTAPAKGEPQRDAINSIVDGIVQDVVAKIADLRRQLDDMEQAVIESAATSKARLQAQVLICIKASEEVNRIAGAVARMRDGMGE
jgi:hypothetical protein